MIDLEEVIDASIAILQMYKPIMIFTLILGVAVMGIRAIQYIFDVHEYRRRRITAPDVIGGAMTTVSTASLAPNYTWVIGVWFALCAVGVVLVLLKRKKSQTKTDL